ncbi:MAG TPA: metallophosphoesterase [Candidatus Cryosericum sp.]|nr:metallophosphoesterase [Candidatus Cryosericum sp.]
MNSFRAATAALAKTASAAALAILLLSASGGEARAHAPIEEQVAALTLRIEADPSDAQLYLRRGQLYRLMRRTAAARADCQRARSLGRGLPAASLCLAVLELEAGRCSESLPAIEAYLRARPDDPEGLWVRGRARAGLGRFPEAAEDFSRAIAAARPPLLPSPDLYIERARALAAAGDSRLDEALGGLEEGLARLGPAVSLEQAAADLEVRLGREEAAAERRVRLGRAGPDHRVLPPVTAASARDVFAERVSPADAAADSPAVITRGPYLQRGTAEEIVVRWRTDQLADSLVRYGTAPDDLRFEARDARLLRNHEMTLQGLEPETRYYYAVGSSTGTLAGGVGLSFATAPRPGTRRSVRIWSIGDSGTANEAARRVRDSYLGVAGGRLPEVWLMLGDNAYPDGTDAQYQAAVFDMYPGFLAGTVLWPTLGNHDGISAHSATQSGPYYDIFTLPTAAQAGGLPSGTEAYYSFDYANLHFICLDSHETDRSPQGAMMTWLRADALSTKQDWTIAFWHHPPYTKGSHDSDFEFQLIDMRENALPILEAAGVDLVLTGHSHSYERSFLLDGHYGRSTTLVPSMKKDPGDGRPEGTGAYAKPTAGPGRHEGAVYVVAGSSGQTSGGPLNHPAMFLSLNSLGSLVLDVVGLRMEATFLDDAGRVRDSFTLLKGPQNHPPVAKAVAPHQIECDQHGGGVVRLDGSGSSDPDAGEDGRIAAYEWFEAYGSASERRLGSGALIEVMLPPGVHAITLRVTDAAGAWGTDTTEARVVDTVPPRLLVTVDPDVLWPPDHALREVRIDVLVEDACDPSPGVVLVGATSDEPDDARGLGDGMTRGDVQGASLGAGGGRVSLRAERDASGSGRTYTITCAASDAAGMTTPASARVLVPRQGGGMPESH